MASPTAITVLYGFSVLLFCCLQLHEAATRIPATQGGLERLAAAAFAPSVLATLVLTPLLSFAHARELGRGAAAGGRPVAVVLARQTFLAATVALLSCAVLQLGADGHLDRGGDDVARLNVK